MNDETGRAMTRHRCPPSTDKALRETSSLNKDKSCHSMLRRRASPTLLSTATTPTNAHHQRQRGHRRQHQFAHRRASRPKRCARQEKVIGDPLRELLSSPVIATSPAAAAAAPSSAPRKVGRRDIIQAFRSCRPCRRARPTASSWRLSAYLSCKHASAAGDPDGNGTRGLN